MEFLEVFGVFLKVFGYEECLVEVVVGNESRGKELVFVANPFEACLDILVVVAFLAKFVNIVAYILVVQGAVVLLKHATLLLAWHLEVPIHVEVDNILRDNLFHAVLSYFHLQAITIFGQGVTYVPLSTTHQVECHIDCAVGSCGGEVQTLCVYNASTGLEDESVVVVVLFEEYYVGSIFAGVVFVIFKRSLAQVTATTRKFECDNVIFEGDGLILTFSYCSKCTILSKHLGFVQRVGSEAVYFDVGHSCLCLSIGLLLPCCQFKGLGCLNGSNRVIVSLLCLYLLGRWLCKP